MSRDKAPDNMPTDLIRTFIKNSESEAIEWTRSAATHRERMEAAESMAEKCATNVQVYNEWLHNRLEQEVDHASPHES